MGMPELSSRKGEDDRRPRYRGRQRRRDRGRRQRRRQARAHRDRAAAAGVSREGEVGDPEALTAAIKELFAENKLVAQRPHRHRQPAGRRPHAAPAADRERGRDRGRDPLPGPGGDPDAARPGGARLAGARAPTPRSAREGKMDVVVVAARRDMVSSLARVVRDAGLRPIGLDVSAFALIRALGRHRLRSPPVSYEERADAGGGGRGRPRRPRAASLQPRRHHQPRRRPQRRLPLHPRLALRNRGDRPATRRAPRADPRALARVARPRRRRGAGRDDRRRPGDRRRGPRGPRRTASPSSSTSSGSRSTTTAPRRAPARSRRSSSAAPARSSRAFPAQIQAQLGYALRVGNPPALASLDAASSARLTVPYGLALEE